MNTESKSILLTSKKTDFNVNIYPPISNGKHDIALIGLSMYNSIPNIDEDNNKFLYEYKNEKYTIVIPEGSYEIEGINDYIQEHLKKDRPSHIDLFKIRANLNTLKCVIEIYDPDIRIFFDHNNSLKDLLGFTDNALQGVSSHESTNIVDILRVNAVLVHCSVIDGSYYNDKPRPILYTFFPNVPPGYKIVEKPNSTLFLPITIPVVSSMRVWLTDQNNKLLNVRGEEINIKLQIRSKYDTWE